MAEKLAAMILLTFMFKFSDYDDCVLPFLPENEPSYVLYRMDTKNNQGYQWLFIAYSPDFAKVYFLE